MLILSRNKENAGRHPYPRLYPVCNIVGIAWLNENVKKQAFKTEKLVLYGISLLSLKFVGCKRVCVSLTLECHPKKPWFLLP